MASPSRVAGNGGAGTEVLVRYERTGGLMGVDDRLVIHADGDATANRRDGPCQFSVDSETRNRLRGHLNDADFSDLKDAYPPPRSGADFFSHTVTFEGHSVRAVDTTVPQRLWPAIELLIGLMEKCGDAR